MSKHTLTLEQKTANVAQLENKIAALKALAAEFAVSIAKREDELRAAQLELTCSSLEYLSGAITTTL